MKRSLIQLVAYVLLNILVSATTVLFVLLLWDQRRAPAVVDPWCLPAQVSSMAGSDAPGVAETAEARMPVIPPLETTVLEIEVIYGAGYVQDEQVVIRRVDEGDLEMRGWWLEDEDGNRFPFPVLTMKPNSKIQINSRGGADTAIDLFWNRSESIWQKGETARVFDPMGNQRAEYQIP